MSKKSGSKSSRSERRAGRQRTERALEHGLPPPKRPRVRAATPEPGRNPDGEDRSSDAPPAHAAKSAGIPTLVKVVGVAVVILLGVYLLSQKRDAELTETKPAPEPAASASAVAVAPVAPPATEAETSAAPIEAPPTTPSTDAAASPKASAAFVPVQLPSKPLVATPAVPAPAKPRVERPLAPAPAVPAAPSAGSVSAPKPVPAPTPVVAPAPAAVPAAPVGTPQ